MPVAAAKGALSSHFDGLLMTGQWLAGQSGLIAAVSGGPDSLALALVAAEVCAEASVRFEAVVIDHGLRDNSTAEAQQVVAALTSRKIPARYFTVSGPAPLTGKQAWAREKRLQILCDYARQNASAVLFAHHRDDQAETVMMRLSRGSGLTGLSAIAPYSLYQGVVFGRPFLGLSKEELISVCQAYGADFVTDPSNADPVFERVRTRQWLQRPEQKQMLQQMMRLAAASSGVASRVREECERWCAEHAVFTHRLCAEIDRHAFLSLRGETRRHMLRLCLAIIGSQPYPVSTQTLDRVLDRLMAGHKSTAGGCLIQMTKTRLRLIAEFGRPPEPALKVSADRLYVFDRRWLVYVPQDGVIRRLGAQGWAARDRQHPVFERAKTWPARVGMMLPYLDGLDGQHYHPHFKSYPVVCSAAGRAAAQDSKLQGQDFVICDLPPDGALTLTKRLSMTESKGEGA